MLQSQLFQGDQILEAVAADQARISRTQNNVHDTVERVQKALLLRDSNCLPQFGADGDYGDETAGAVKQLKIDEFTDLTPDQIFDDVGPRTVLLLDQIAFSNEQPIPPPPPPPPTTFTRRDAWAIDTDINDWNPIMLAYAKAVRLMQTKLASDPTSWQFQAAIHGTFMSPAQPTWNQCEHGNWFFLPWHRMYLFFFEKIVRAAVQSFGGPADFALPYWNYENAAPSDTIPLAFRRQFLDDGVTPNPLRIDFPIRRNGVNDGTLRVNRLVNSTAAMAMTKFVDPPGPGFGGGVMRRNHRGPQGAFAGAESNPHNPIHGAIGGDRTIGQCGGAFMTDPDCAALDPIFWLHHANIDRLWNRWIALGGGRTNPGNASWLNERFTLHDETGTAVTIAVSDVLDSNGQLHYVYDDVPAVVIPIVGEEVTEPAPPEMVGATDQTIEVGSEPVSISIAIPDVSQDLVGSLIAGTTRVLLTVEDIQAERNPGIGWALFVNRPAVDDPATIDQTLVGTMSLFGVEAMNDPNDPAHGAPGMRHTFNITQLVQTLGSMNLWDPTQVTVTIEPFDLMESDDPSLQTDLTQIPPIRIGRVSLFVG
jgi:Common central domain of tyrosinase/Polyphenol oxidase middle domain